MTNLKIYIEQLCKSKQKIDVDITSYLKQDSGANSVVFKDKGFQEDFSI